jgi:hypothetical protein
MKTNRKFKDSVFTKLFSDPDLLRELYCALEEVSLPPDVPVSINTLENVLYMDLFNDISFVIGGKLIVLIEHQSTINPNMALRLLLYYTNIIERTVTRKGLYTSKPLSIPWPEFYVLYNGTQPYPDESVLRLSDLFENPQDLGLPAKATPLLDLQVKVININEGRNDAIINRCQKLAEYSAFIGTARVFLNEYDNKEEAIKEAVKYCQKHAILKEFLDIHASEVLNMLLSEWNIEDAKEVWQEEAREEGKFKEKQKIAMNLLAEGATHEFVQKITGLDLETIKQLN